MKLTRIAGVDDARAKIGEELGVSDWLLIDQARIDAFADATRDTQWIHVDVERAQRESPFGATIAHGYLTLSLLARFFEESVVVENIRMQVNYGCNRIRFPAAVKSGSRVRGRFTLKELSPIDGGTQVVWDASVEIEGTSKPGCQAELVARWYF